MTLETFHSLALTLMNFCVVLPLFLKGIATKDNIETVIPAIIFSKGGLVYPNKIVFTIKAKQTTFVIRLRKNKDLLPDNFQLDFGNGKTAKPIKQESQCYYQGKLNNLGRKRHHSKASISTCGGLHGVFEDGDCIYYIAPHNFSDPQSNSHHLLDYSKKINSVHYLYNMTGLTKKTSMNCKSSGVSITRLRERVDAQSKVRYSRQIHLNRTNEFKSSFNSANDTKYIELYLVNDNSLFEHYGRNSAILERRSKLIANILDARFKPLNIRIVLVGIEVWTSEDKVQFVDSSVQSLWNFLKYRSKYINKKYHNDNAQLITRRSFDGGATAGKAPLSTMCSWRYSGGINQDTHENPLYIATVIAHELGHNLGMQHDFKETCMCNDHLQKKCIMSDALDASVRSFSSCSQKYLANALVTGQGHCLYDLPQSRKLPGTCGNGILDKGEECDCGSREKCGEAAQCCNPDTCLLREGASCSKGECCEKCRYKKGGTSCRKRVSECDLPEYCTGYSGECPKNVFIKNGYSCSNGSAYCQDGICLSRDYQCRINYGEKARASHSSCYSLFNSRGNNEGNCGKRGPRFKRCAPKHAMCGTLQCNNEMPKSSLSTKMVLLYCFTNQSHRFSSRKERLIVNNGTKCGQGRVCFKQKCVRMKVYYSYLNHKSCSLNCSGRGVCNSNDNCHCDLGWSPPHCDRPGNGGSIDSGKPLSLRKHKKKTKRLKDIGKPIIAIITVGLVCAIVFVLVATKFSFRRICRTVTKREKERNRAPRGELRHILDRH